MLVGAGNTRHRLVQAVLLVTVLAGCSEAADDDAKAKVKTAESASSSTDGTGAESGGSIGADGSACELPVTFDIAEEWTAEAVDAGSGGDASGGTDGELADELADAFLRQGPVSLACEVDAKPAGHIGYLRVWTGAPGDADARTVLEAFVTDDDAASKARYSTFKAGGLTGVEVEYLYTSEFLDEPKTEHALAVTTPRGPVVVHLGGLDSEEHEAMLPAYELAKRTLKA
ncbi:lipoprotein [Streptomyces sp. ADMS]|uniref:lipoprotein n=1 Tax=Streptomyces sp. ADMS TaxID=3071415 RepID=UPI00296EC1A4|nr:lipoprotein [Streptomyces sp. ADMS]MDW4903781.1 lipoprotein [Streptomyces sp. ADMS]